MGESIAELDNNLNVGWNMITGLTSTIQVILIIDEENIIKYITAIVKIKAISLLKKSNRSNEKKPQNNIKI